MAGCSHHLSSTNKDIELDGPKIECRHSGFLTLKPRRAALRLVQDGQGNLKGVQECSNSNKGKDDVHIMVIRKIGC